ncbi:MAG: MoxR family ATPase [Deltaproteobacteria bacterium]|nr:MoxR family ATPase [Deltaproteobacteria bacterium]
MTNPTLDISSDTTDKLHAVKSWIETVIRGKSEVVSKLLICLLAKGHVLLEDVPGVGKTTLAHALSAALDLRFSRIQFTPDLLPQDLLGANVLNPRDGSFTFHKGPVFTHLLLADEINRASPRTQSALLEAMNEQQVTIDGETFPLSSPFMVIATENPVEFQGTYPLPEAQLDRFMMRLSMGYPSPDEELLMLKERRADDPLRHVHKVLSAKELPALQQKVCEVTVSEDVAKYMLRLVGRTRRESGVEIGASPRASLALYHAAQAQAFFLGRTYVSPKDVQELFADCMTHRLVLNSAARYGGMSAAHIINTIVAEEPVPA